MKPLRIQAHLFVRPGSPRLQMVCVRCNQGVNTAAHFTARWLERHGLDPERVTPEQRAALVRLAS